MIFINFYVKIFITHVIKILDKESLQISGSKEFKKKKDRSDLCYSKEEEKE